MGLESILRSFHRSELFARPMRYVSRRYGTNIYSRKDEWDMLLILDAAKYGIMKEFADNYDYITEVGSMNSRGSNSSEWVHNTFIHDYDKYESLISDTHYVTDNIFSLLVLSGVGEKELYRTEFEDKSLVEYIEQVKNSDTKNVGQIYPVFLDEGEFQSDGAFRPPDLVTSKCMDLIDDGVRDNIVCHYMMPHEPFVEGLDTDASNWPNSVENRSMINMDNDYYERLMYNYRKNHEYILDHLRKLLQYIPDDMEVAITADHGNITSKVAGYSFAMGHPQYLIRPKGLRRVPWIRVDQSEVEGDFKETDIKRRVSDETRELEADVVSERLEDLGYK